MDTRLLQNSLERMSDELGEGKEISQVRLRQIVKLNTETLLQVLRKEESENEQRRNSGTINTGKRQIQPSTSLSDIDSESKRAKATG